MDERLELCYRGLMARHNRLKGTPSDVAPILWQNGALARLKKGETIDKLLNMSGPSRFESHGAIIDGSIGGMKSFYNKLTPE